MNSIKLIDKLISTYRKNSNWIKILKLAKEFINKDSVLLLQEYLRDTGSDITVDGILGKKTIGFMVRRKFDKLLELYNSITTTKKDISLRTRVLDYLAAAEGRHLHWNKTESSFTTMYGIYAKKHKRSKPVMYIRRRARELGFRTITRNNIHKLDRALTKKDRSILTSLIYNFYVKNMFLPEIIDLVSTDTYLTYFSIAVHGGKPRGVKALKHTLRMPVNKIWTTQDTDALRTTRLTDVAINNGMLDYMQAYYDYLIRTNPRKYGSYKRGWRNRLRKLRRNR